MTPIQQCSALGFAFPVMPDGVAVMDCQKQSIFLKILELLEAHPPQCLLCDSVAGALGKMQDDRSLLQVSLAGLTFSKILCALTLFQYPRSQIFIHLMSWGPGAYILFKEEFNMHNSRGQPHIEVNEDFLGYGLVNFKQKTEV